MAKRIRVLLADDHQLVRQGLRALIEARTDWEICGEAATGREAVKKARDLKPDVVLMDITMSELNGLEATRQILKAVPQTEVLVLTVHDSQQMALRVLDAGARGYVLKSDAVRDLVVAVETISQHGLYFTPRVSDALLKGYRNHSTPIEQPEGSWNSLTPREREIIQLLAEGKSNKEIATALGISVRTAEAHRANILRRLNLHSTVELVHYAFRNEIVGISK